MTTFNLKINDTEMSSLGQSVPVVDEKNKQCQKELLMEKLKSHQTQYKSFPELAKSFRMAMLEKRYALDAVEKSNLQKCLDSMQHCIKVTTKQGLIERLENLSRQLGLKFMEDSSGLFISSDMFFLEIILDPNGTLSDVKVHHECKIEQQSCSELVACLLNGDFADFTNQLEGLSSIYQLNAEPKIKSKAFVALQAMETDLYNLFEWKNCNKDLKTILKESPVSIVQKRRGGHPMKLTYFISPYDLLSLESNSMQVLTMDLLKNADIGMSVTVNLEASSANKLQILPSVSFSKDTNYPVYSIQSPTNSTLLPATFVLRLQKPLPTCSSLFGLLGITFESTSDLSTILNLTVQTASKGQIQNSSKGLFVSLPDQNHCYFFTENKNMRGSLITSVPFTEPSQVTKILSALKQQALFYTMLASCVRPDARFQTLENTTMLEVNAISLNKISVSLQHSNEDAMVSIEFDLIDLSNIRVTIYSITSSLNLETVNQKLGKIASATLSIPITIRYLLRLWAHEQLHFFLRRPSVENINFDLPSCSNNDSSRMTTDAERSANYSETKVKYEKNDIANNSNANIESNSFSLTGQRQKFFHTSGVSITPSELYSESNIMSSSSLNPSNVIVSQFKLKNNQPKDFVTPSASQHEDFCKSPKSEIEKSNQYSLGQNLFIKKPKQILQ